MEIKPQDSAEIKANEQASVVSSNKNTHRPGEKPGQKISPVKQNKKPILEIKKLTKEFNNFVAVNNVDLTVYQGEIFALLGSSGCGKSTLLRMLAGFETPSSGHIILEGKDIGDLPPYKRNLNMMFQSYALFPYMNVWQNIAFGLKQEHLAKNIIEERVEKMLKLVHMEDYVERKPYQLSGGQRQRVALARSLAKEPKLLLLDEPMGALDKKLREQMRLELVDIINSVGVTCLMVTHDQEEAMTMADRIAIMDRGEFVQIGGPIELMHDLDLADGMPLSIAMRPEKIYISHEKPEEEANWCEGVVENIAYLGDISIYYVRLNSGRVISSTLPNVDRFNVGLPTWDDHVYLSWDPESCIALTF